MIRVGDVDKPAACGHCPSGSCTLEQAARRRRRGACTLPAKPTTRTVDAALILALNCLLVWLFLAWWS